ncbi:MAG TPA: hypothetical protein VFN44_02820, partial [Solirubrobacteraceae bacterium]|nr:hypothetical protein [Solirubrobacteraceae bacterium]
GGHEQQCGDDRRDQGSHLPSHAGLLPHVARASRAFRPRADDAERLEDRQAVWTEVRWGRQVSITWKSGA